MSTKKKQIKTNARYDYKKFRLIRASKDKSPQGFRNLTNRARDFMLRLYL